MVVQGEFFERPEGTNDELDMPAIASEEASTEPIAISEQQPLARRSMRDLSIPKLYYSISEVSRLTGLEQYVLRYWETEFEELRPQKNRAGNRIYSNKDIKFILKIRELLREKRYTIEGAKQILKEDRIAEREAEKRAETNEGNEEPQPVSEDPSQLTIIAEIESHVAPKIASVTLAELGKIKEELRSLKTLLTRG